MKPLAKCPSCHDENTTHYDGVQSLCSKCCLSEYVEDEKRDIDDMVGMFNQHVDALKARGLVLACTLDIENDLCSAAAKLADVAKRLRDSEPIADIGVNESGTLIV